MKKETVTVDTFHRELAQPPTASCKTLRSMPKTAFLFLFAVAACAHSPDRSQSTATVLPGIEVFVGDVPQPLRGKPVALITNQSGIDRAGTSDIDLTGTIDRLTGSDKVRLAIEDGRLPALLDEWDREAAEFRQSRRPFLLYR